MGQRHAENISVSLLRLDGIRSSSHVVADELVNFPMQEELRPVSLQCNFVEGRDPQTFSAIEKLTSPCGLVVLLNASFRLRL